MLKRGFDLILSMVGLAVLSPLLLLIAVLIKRADGGPVFYRGVRVGLHGRDFRIFKFRSMVLDAEKLGASSTSDDDQRITSIGKILRRYKLDELPQLFNVLTGDMSFVGPRPEVRWATDLYTDEEKIILAVRPGITDYASIKFHNEGEILKGSQNPDQDYLTKIHPVKTALAMQYAKEHSMAGDFLIILKTLTTIIVKEGH